MGSDGNLYYALVTQAVENANEAVDNVSRPVDTACQLVPWFYSVGFVLTFAPLFTKLMRVYRIFANESLKAIRITMGQMLMCIAVVLAIDAFIFCCGPRTILCFKREVLESDPYGNPVRSVGLCITKEDPFTYVGPIMGLHIVVLLVGNYLAYKTREIGTAFSESKYISIAMVSNLQVLALSIPVLLIVADNAQSNWFVRTGVVFLNDFTVLNLIFLPKFLDVTIGTNILGTEIKSMGGSSTVQTATHVTQS